MHSWSNPEIPVLEGKAPLPVVFNRSNGQRERTTAENDRAGLYVCGITPYDATHLGHAVTYLAFDTLNRLWRDAGLQVRYVQNVTDIDDPLLERAHRDAVDWRDLAADQIELFRLDMAALRIIPPTEYVSVTESIPEIAAAVEKLIRSGYAYSLDVERENLSEIVDYSTPYAGKDIYFDVTAAERETEWFLGQQSRYSRGEMLQFSAERGGDPQRQGKKSPLDPLLWRAARKGEPFWPAPMGHGRPGWHVECSAIALKHLGSNFTVQAGGNDLIFPHHEFSAAHAIALTAKPFAQIYAHAGMLAYRGEKMSKSRGNLVFVSRLLQEGVDPRVLRLALLGHHYRSDWEWKESTLVAAAQRFERWRAAAQMHHSSSNQSETQDSAVALLKKLRDCLADDLDVPGALEQLDRWFAQTETVPESVVNAIDALLGIRLL